MEMMMKTVELARHGPAMWREARTIEGSALVHTSARQGAEICLVCS